MDVGRPMQHCTTLVGIGILVTFGGVVTTITGLVALWSLLFALGLFSDGWLFAVVFMSSIVLIAMLYAGVVVRHTRSLSTGVVLSVLIPALVIGSLFLLRNTLREYPCDASAVETAHCPGGVSNAPGP